MLTRSGLELSFILPSEYSNQFEKLFTEIEEKREELGISSYGASVTTLEEVFIKVGEEQDEESGVSTRKELFRQLSGTNVDKENKSMVKIGRFWLISTCACFFSTEMPNRWMLINLFWCVIVAASFLTDVKFWAVKSVYLCLLLLVFVHGIDDNIDTIILYQDRTFMTDIPTKKNTCGWCIVRRGYFQISVDLKIFWNLSVCIKFNWNLLHINSFETVRTSFSFTF